MSISRITTGRVRKWVTVSMILVLVASLIVWSLDRRTVPRRIRIAAGADRGLYHQVGSAIKESLEKRIVSSVEVLETLGSRDNFERLVAGDAELAIVQGGSVPLEDACVITPLFPEYVFVIARNNANIQEVWELAGRRVSLGARGSGNRASALKVLRHFGVDESEILGDSEVPFTALAHDESIDAAIVTAGIEHPMLRELLATNQFSIVPIRSAMAMELVHPFVLNVEIPQGLFGEHPSLPDKPIPTIAATAYLVCESGAPSDLVQAALESIHEESLRLKLPTLIPRQDVPRWTATKLHPTSQRYFHPEDEIGEMVAVMESVIATKELLFAFGAGIYLLWMRWRRLKEKEQMADIDRQKEHLDRLLTETLSIEKADLQSCSKEQLLDYLGKVTNIKLRALQEFTEEELRGNRAFSILLDQCSGLISKIQLQLVLTQSGLAKDAGSVKQEGMTP